MKAEQAWQTALEHLQYELSTATFNTWVRDSTLVAYDDGLFLIGVANDYVREWLECRLSSTVIRLLTGLMNQSIQVHFMVNPSDRNGVEDYEAKDSQATPKLGEEEKQLKIQLAHASLRDEFIHPNRVIVIPGYFQRWLPYLGPTLAWIVVAFRQAMYMATHHETRAGIDFEVSPASVARWAGIDRTTLWRRLNDRMLGWFLKRTSPDRNTFRFIASMPLTPGDAQFLQNWLLAFGAHENPIAALEKSLAGEPGSIFTTPQLSPTQAHLTMKPDPQSVQDVVLNTCGRIDKKATLAKVLELADQLAARLMPPGDAIHITHYFMLHHLPELGGSPAWFVTLLRDRCYVDKDNPRDTVWIRGGYREIAKMLGLRRPKTIREWLPPAYERKTFPTLQNLDDVDRLCEYDCRARLRADRRFVINQFIQRTETFAISSTGSWNFKVTLIEPLSPEDQAAYDWIINLVGTYLETGKRSEIDTILASGNGDRSLEAGIQKRMGANATILIEDEAHMQRDEARMQPGRGANATPRGANATNLRRGCNTMRRECNALNPLNLLVKLLEQLGLNSINPVEAIPEVSTVKQIAKPEESVVVVEPNWDLSVLFSRNPSVKNGTQKILLEQNASAPAFVSWLLYTASPAGRGITKPAQFAASKLMGNSEVGAGSIYNRLASLSPKTLYELIDGALSGFRQYSTIPSEVRADWQSVMANASTDRIVALKGQLFE